MSFFHNYPYTDFHELNLDWLLAEFKSYAAKYDAALADISEYEERITEAFENFKNGMTGDFDEFKNEIETIINDFILSISSQITADVNNWLDAHPEATTTVQDGSITLQKLHDSLKTLTLKDCLIPDMFSGTDTQKLQACLDELSLTGGIILINRTYQLTANLINKLNTDTTGKAFILLLGIGKNAGIDMGEYSFVSDLSNAAVGGLHFNNLSFEGTEKFVNGHDMIRMFFMNCRFYGFKYIVYGEGVTQSIYFEQCYFDQISEYVFINASDGVWNIGFTQCICENSGGFYSGDPDHLSNGNYNIVIKDCCIETMSKSCIEPSSNTINFVISGCYFEAAQPIDLARCGGATVHNITIEDNVFFLDENTSAIIMPTSNAGATQGIRGVITRNSCVPATRTLAESDPAVVGIIRYQFTNNFGVIDVPSRYAQYTPLYGEVVTTTYTGEVAADGDILIDESVDFRTAISISLINQKTQTSYRIPGGFVYVRDSAPGLYFHNGSTTTTVTLKVVSILPTS